MSPSFDTEPASSAFELSSISTALTERTLVDILNKAFEGDRCLASWRVAGTPGAKGDSYLSEVVRMTVQAVCPAGEEEKYSVHLVIKSLPSNISRRKTFRSTDFFRNEIKFYEHVVPVLEAFQRQQNVDYKLFPKCYASICDGENDFLALEDLGKSGYGSAVRQDGMSYGQCRAVMSALANFHALSYALRDQQPAEYRQAIDVLEETYFSARFADWIRAFHVDQIACVRDAVAREYPGTVYERKLVEFTDENYFRKMLDQVQGVDGGNHYAVINHGDSWIPNFMFDATDVVKLIDFQLVREASPICDVMLVFYSGTTQELRERHFKELIKYYYDCLSRAITELGSDAAKLFPESALQEQLRKYSKFGLGFSFEAVPFSVMENEDTPDLNSLEGEEAVPLNTIFVVHLIETQKGRLRLADNVRHAVDNGFL